MMPRKKSVATSFFFIPGLTTKQDLELGELGGVEPYLMNFSTLNSELPESEIMRSDKAYGCRGQERGRESVSGPASSLSLAGVFAFWVRCFTRKSS